MVEMFGFGYGWGMLIGLVVLALIAYVIYYAVTGSSRDKRSSSYRSQRALEILKERYARGEITREQFLKMRRELEA
jgi:putative membrane protein